MADKPVATFDCSTQTLTYRDYDDIEKAERVQWGKEQPSLTFKEIRKNRNARLAETDWIITKAAEAKTDVASDMVTYRQALRDMPSTLNDSSVLNFDFEDGWPDKPLGGDN